MKKFIRCISGATAMIVVAALLPACSLEAPFDAAGEGTLTLNTDIRGDVVKTRAIGAEDLASLRENCVVYIENSKGLIQKFKGLDNIPAEIRLRTGDYVAEAWSGDSVSASFSSKFYRGYRKFQIAEGNNSLTLNCNIANVVVSVDPASLDVDLQDLKVTFSHSRGELQFTQDNIDSKGYFMMPNADKDLNYKVEGKMANGSNYLKEGVIPNVQRAHEYALKISANQASVTEGGALIKIVIADIPLIEETVDIYAPPAIKGDGFNIDEQLVSLDRAFNDTRIYVRGYNGISSMVMNTSSNFTNHNSGKNILDNSVKTELMNQGIKIDKLPASQDAGAAANGVSVPVDEYYITFTKNFLESLPASSEEYKVTFIVTDGNHRQKSASLRIANDPAAVEQLPPVTTGQAIDTEKDPMAVGAYKATVTCLLNTSDATGFGVKYRRSGDSAWQQAMPTSANQAAARRNARNTRALEQTPYTVVLTGLTPDTEYEYAAFADGYELGDIRRFRTEGIFTIPNASFEDWSSYTAKTLLGNRSVVIPWSVGDKNASFWGSGNEGSATANTTLTNKSSDMVHSGAFAARLESKSVMNVLAAGNLFVGTYVETDGTNGVLSLGRPYNGSHPAKLRFWVNYRPGSGVSIKSENKDFVALEEGGKDHGQIYVALTDEPIEIRTNPSKRKLFDPEDPHVLAYNQVTWTDNFGPDGALQMFELPINYNERAKTKRPTHMIIVISASKYGDFFSGASGSLFYLDDFEFVYE
ncbi:MAG: PCMD domain-containing protein [Muribaculaceae bacterium]|nr:PCMD domain-containing protein [Muribaculaceae bacterium]